MMTKEEGELRDARIVSGKEDPPPDVLVVGRPNIGDRQRFMERVEDILDRRWLSNGGKYVQEFEARLAEYLAVSHCIAMCNATVGLEIAIRALELRGEVIVPSFTFVATVHALRWQEIKPVFCDIDPATHNLDPAQVEKLVTPRTTGILGVHLWGRACAVEQLQEIASRHKLRLLFDASHALGCTHQGRLIGGFGEAEVFSFHATKFINTLEGGAVTTNDSALAARIRLMKNFGFTGYDRVNYLGVNGKMNEISAAMGLTNLEAMADFTEANRRNYEAYREELAGCSQLEVVPYPEGEKQNYQYVIVSVAADAPAGLRDEIVSQLHRHNVVARRYFYPGVHRFEPYRTEDPQVGVRLPETEKLAQQLICLPTGSTVSRADIRRVCSIMREALESASLPAR